jgi:hypothetical protein
MQRVCAAHMSNYPIQQRARNVATLPAPNIAVRLQSYLILCPSMQQAAFREKNDQQDNASNMGQRSEARPERILSSWP